MNNSHIAVAALIFVSVLSFPAQAEGSFDHAIAQYSAENGADLASAPKIKPDGKLYFLHGKIQLPDDGSAGFMANLAPSEENELLANTLRRARGMGESTDYFGVALPDAMEKYYFDNARVGSGFDLVGRYVANMKYSTVGGRELQAPVFEAVYFDLWNKRHSVAPTNATSPQSAAAQQADQPGATYEKCINDAGGVMPDMIDCSAAEAKRQDVRLNAAYKIAMNKAPSKEDLKNKQRAWIKERDKACAVDEDGGQAAVLNSNECIAQKTSQRAGELEAIR